MSDGDRAPIPPSWAWSSLGGLGSWVGGGTPSKDNQTFWVDGTIPWVSPKDMKSFEIHATEDQITEDAVAKSATTKIRAGAVLVVTRSGILRHTLPVAVTCREVALNQDLKALVPHTDLYPRYLAYALLCFAQGILHTCSKDGTTVQSIESAALKRFEIPIAPFAEQIRIADALDEIFSDLDSGVAALERVRDRLKLYRASVLKAAVEGTLTEEWRAGHPDREPASVLLEQILVERRRRWQEQQIAKAKTKGREPPRHWKAARKGPSALDVGALPSLPEGWCWVRLDQLGDVGTGATPNRSMKSRYYDRGSIPWVTSTCVNKPFVDAPSEFVTSTALAECNLTIYPPGTLLLAMYGEGKTRGMSSQLRIASTTNQALAAIDAPPSVRRYLKIFLAKNYEDIRRAASGGVQPNLNLGIVREISLPLPPNTEQEVIVDIVDDQLSVIDHLESDIDTKLKSARALRQSILHRAFTGQLVPQDPSDEPASELLKRIVAERQVRGNGARPHSANRRARPAPSRRRK